MRAERSMEVCIWCVNNNKEVCVEECQPEGKYRYLEPEVLEPWEQGPELPPMRELIEKPPEERLAIIWLNSYYRDPRNDGRNSL